MAKKIALVTGASGGIGSACARELAGRGYTVLVHGNRGYASAKALAHELCEAGMDALALCCDLADSRAVTAMCGALLFLGIILGLVCLFATVLIVYYKQISEGYEDRARFQIMQKVGMSRREVKSTINSQVLLVFFLPLVVAGMHLAFAFPILEKVLHILLLSSTSLFVACSLITFGVFAGVYVVIYLGTARTYYKIVR